MRETRLILHQLPAWWGGGPILCQTEDPLTVTITATTDDDDDLKGQILEQDKLLSSHALVQVCAFGGPEHPGPSVTAFWPGREEDGTGDGTQQHFSFLRLWLENSIL